MIQLLLIGLISILGQVVLLRELNVAFFGIELIYALALGIWLLCTAAGAGISRRTLEPPSVGVDLLFLAFALLLPLDIAFIRGMRRLFAGVPGAYLPFPTQMVALFISLFPISVILGWLFQWAAKQHISEKKSLARAYSIESAGGLAGGILATLFLRAGIQNITIGLLCALVAVAGAILRVNRRRPALVTALAASLTVPLLFSMWQAPALDRWMASWLHPHLVETSDSPYGRITITESGGQIAVFENDALSFTTEGTEAEEFAHLAAVQHPGPLRILILGGGIEGTVREILKHGPNSVDYVELNPVLLRIARRHLPPEIQQSLDAANVRIRTADPRSFLAAGEKYDLIMAGLPEPASGQNNRFYTMEFFAQCKERLSSGGILAFRLKSSENLWTPQLTRRTTSIYRALKSVFAEITVLPGSSNIFIASTDPLAADPATLGTRLRERHVQANLVSPAYIRYLYTNDRFSQILEVLKSAPTPANSDTKPICYQYTLMIWLSKFYPTLAFPDLGSLIFRRSALSTMIVAAGLALSVLLLLVRRRGSLKGALLVAFAGFIGMVLETILMLHYQVKKGVLYQDIGVLLTSFMAGLALGAIALDRWIASSSHNDGFSWRRGATLPIGFAVVGALTVWHVNADASLDLWITAFLLFASGFLVAGTFALAGSWNVGDQRQAVAPLYAADLAGGCLGSLTASLFLVPFAGLSAAVLSIVPLALVSLLLLRQPPREA